MQNSLVNYVLKKVTIIGHVRNKINVDIASVNATLIRVFRI